MIASYIDYFRQIAVKHAKLLHDPATETGNGPEGAMHFTKVNIDEVLFALNSAAGFPLLLLELYEVTSEAEIVSDFRSVASGAFMVVDHPADKTFASHEQCYITTETIVYDILQKMWNDNYGPGSNACDTPFEDIPFDSIGITPVGPIFAGEYGYRVEFDFRLRQARNITQPLVRGMFIEND